MGFNIAIDGPAGAGKSTIAKMIAAKKGYIYVDTGAMYRAMALYLLREKATSEQIDEKCQGADITIAYENGEQVVYLNGENVNPFIRTEEVGRMASVSSPNAKVRKKLVELQQKLAEDADVVMDGRDIGTVVFPDAELKLFMTADPKVRAQRRYDELTAKGQQVTLEEIERNVRARDEADMSRAISPLRQADDAVVLDNSRMTVDEQMEWFMKLFAERTKNE